MIKILLTLVFVVVVIMAAVWASGYFSEHHRAARADYKANIKSQNVRTKELEADLAELRERARLSERALREIASGSEYPNFVADNALLEINHPNKEIK